MIKKIVYDKNNNIIYEEEGNNLILDFCEFLYIKCILKNKNYRVHYKYSYNDLQTVTFTEINAKIKIVFKNIPTQQAFPNFEKLDLSGDLNE